MASELLSYTAKPAARVTPMVLKQTNILAARIRIKERRNNSLPNHWPSKLVNQKNKNNAIHTIDGHCDPPNSLYNVKGTSRSKAELGTLSASCCEHGGP